MPKVHCAGEAWDKYLSTNLIHYLPVVTTIVAAAFFRVLWLHLAAKAVDPGRRRVVCREQSAGGFATGVIAAITIRRLARKASIDPTRIILSGGALGAALSAWVGFVVFAADRARVPPIEFWLLGSLAGTTWRALATVLVFVAIATGVLLASARVLDLFRLGESDARHLGIDVDLVRTIILIAVGGAVGSTVGAAGVIVFVGLLVPYVIARCTGPLHRHLLAIDGGRRSVPCRL